MKTAYLHLDQLKQRQENYFDFIGSAVAPDLERFGRFFDGPGLLSWLSGAPPSGHRDLRVAIAAAYRFDSNGIVVTTGASLAMFIVCHALLSKTGTEADGGRILVETPTYDPFIAAAVAAGGKPEPLPRIPPKFDIDIGQLERLLARDRARFVILGNLHNPTGNLIGESALNRLAELAEAFDCPIVFDEVFRDLGPSAAGSSGPAEPAARRSPHFISINSLSKAYGLGVLRCGWILASEKYADKILESQIDIENAGSQLTQAISTMVIDDLEHFRTLAQTRIKVNRQRVQESISALVTGGILTGEFPDYGSVYFPRVNVDDIEGVISRLAASNVFVVPGKFFGAPEHVRIAFGSFVDERHLQEGLDRLTAALQRL